MADVNARLRQMAGRGSAKAKPTKPGQGPDPESILARVEEAVDVLNASTRSLEDLAVDLRSAIDTAAEQAEAKPEGA